MFRSGNKLAALCACALVACAFLNGANAQVTIMDTEKTSEEIEYAANAAIVKNIPAISSDQCAENLQNGSTELMMAFAPCLGTTSASEECCNAVEETFAFANEKFGGCLCYPIVMNTVIELADSFMPGASSLISDALDGCTANYTSSFGFYGQDAGTVQCDESVFVDVDSTFDISGIVTASSGYLDESGLPTVPDANTTDHNMDTALTLLGVLTVEECGVNLMSQKDVLISSMAPCIIAEEPNAMCCSAVEETFSYSNPDFGGCLCHEQVMDGIFAEAENFMPGATELIQEAFIQCTDEHGARFPFDGQLVGHVSCDGESLEQPSLSALGSDGEAKENTSFQSLFQSADSAAVGQNSWLALALAGAVALAVPALF
mmetsp:Transcript_7363/g.18893  ORF Transcript_7363/g.18893 Transcript_7363/m.18893 type:complete len:375 (+) Transcript_7363:182-1306(+)